MKLTKIQRNILQQMADHIDDEEGELLCSRPGGWWLGCSRVAGPTGFFLLRFCLIRKCSFSSEKTERYTINEYGRRALNEPDFDIRNEGLKL